MMSTQSKEIKAVHIADLDDLLKKYDQLQDFASGKMRCQICSKEVSSLNVGSMKRVGEKLVFTCNNISCYRHMVKNTRQ